MTKAPTSSATPRAHRGFCADLIDAIGTHAFFPNIAKSAAQQLSFDGLFICLYSKDSAPSSLGCFNEALNFQSGIENYLKFSYVINPVYRAFQNDVTAGVYVMTDFLEASPKNQIGQTDFPIWIDDQETIGYRTPGWPKNMIEVLGLVWLSDDKMVELCFMNEQGNDQTQTCFSWLKANYSILSSALLKHFEFAATEFDTSNAEPNLEDRIPGFGNKILTEREQTVVQLILKGHSSSSIALILEISLPTVKSHRRNIYAKLQISSQVELFTLFVQEMMALAK